MKFVGILKSIIAELKYNYTRSNDSQLIHAVAHSKFYDCTEVEQVKASLTLGETKKNPKKYASELIESIIILRKGSSLIPPVTFAFQTSSHSITAWPR